LKGTQSFDGSLHTFVDESARRRALIDKIGHMPVEFLPRGWRPLDLSDHDAFLKA
jgi:hypothetical protein